MKYFIDTEFHEREVKNLFSKKFNTIELISIAIISEDNREYYAISKDFDIKAAWNNKWLRSNVLIPIHTELATKENNPIYEEYLITYKSLYTLINKYGKSNTQIAQEIQLFTQFEFQKIVPKLVDDEYLEAAIKNNKYKPEFYGYYSDYDWVVFCWLFGRMIDLPKGFPKFCIDLKQDYDKKLNHILHEKEEMKIRNFKHNPCLEINTLNDYSNYPKQTNEHNALADARWNFELYKFLKTI